jgi:hypothetical protein
MVRFLIVLVRLIVAIFSLVAIIIPVLAIAFVLEFVCAISYFAFCALFYSEEYIKNEAWLRHFPTSIKNFKRVFLTIYDWALDRDKSSLDSLKKEPDDFYQTFLIFTGISFFGIVVVIVGFVDGWLAIVSTVFIGIIFREPFLNFISSVKGYFMEEVKERISKYDTEEAPKGNKKDDIQKTFEKLDKTD